MIRDKDPRIYNKDTKFYSSESESSDDDENENENEPKHKPKKLKDVIREDILSKMEYFK